MPRNSQTPLEVFMLTHLTNEGSRRRIRFYTLRHHSIPRSTSNGVNPVRDFNIYFVFHKKEPEAGSRRRSVLLFPPMNL